MSDSTAPGRRTFTKLLFALLFIVPILLLVKLAVEAKDRDPLSGTLDVQILQWIHGFATPTLTQLVVHITNFGGPIAIVGITAITAAILFFRNKRRAMTLLLIGVGGAGIINQLLKLSFQRIRPSLWAPVITEHSFSFPSGHAMMSSALVFSLILLVWETKWRWYAVVIGLLYTLFIGFTRLYLGVHYPTDVLAGWLFSFVWLLTVRTILSRRQLRAAGQELA